MPYFNSDDQDAGYYDPADDRDDDFRIEFADSGGNSALRAGNRVYNCPTCNAPNRLCAEDVRLGYQCDPCADRAERGDY